MKPRSVSLIAAAALALAAAAGVGIVLKSAARPAGQTPAADAAGARQLWHCGMHPQVIQDHPGDCPICHMALTPFSVGHTARAAGSAGPDVHVDPRVVQNMGVRTAEVTKGTLTKTVRTVGLISLPEPGLHDVSLKVAGWVEKLYADQEGAHVRKGDPLFEVYSPDLQVASQELILAVRALRSLAPDAPEAIRREAQGLVDSARRKLRLWDVDERDVEQIAAASEPPRTVVFRSPASGHVEEKMVVQGSSVQPGMKLLRIADHSKMWLDLQVYEGQLPFVKAGQAVSASVAGVPGESFDGAVSFLYPHFDHASRTLKVRATLDNPEFELKPGMYATAEIKTESVSDVTLAPREAVIDTGTRQIAFVAEGGGHFSARKVRTGLSGDDDKVQIVEGLSPGETVVTSGQFLLDVESRTIEATEKLSAGGAERPAAVMPAMGER
jgi:Cu(I)/Ag(I) efflux system membrane fusion protein